MIETDASAVDPASVIAVSGSTGLVGSELVASLTSDGYKVLRLVRHEPEDAESGICWDPATGRVDADRLAEVDVVVHLAGENIAARRWSAAQKTRIRNSRVEGTRLLCEALARRERRASTLICASAIGYYGDRGDQWLDESSPPGQGFLAEVCRDWEEATAAARDAGIRTVNLRIGVALSAQGGALHKVLTPFRLGLGGVIGRGNQYMSWITLDDLVGAIRHVLANEFLSGPVNAVAPHPVTNRQFTKTLGRVLSRPTIFPMPALAARIAFGQMGDELLLASTRVRPSRLDESGYRFDHVELEEALRHLLDTKGR